MSPPPLKYCHILLIMIYTSERGVKTKYNYVSAIYSHATINGYHTTITMYSIYYVPAIHNPAHKTP